MKIFYQGVYNIFNIQFKQLISNTHGISWDHITYIRDGRGSIIVGANIHICMICPITLF